MENLRYNLKTKIFKLQTILNEQINSFEKDLLSEGLLDKITSLIKDVKRVKNKFTGTESQEQKRVVDDILSMLKIMQEFMVNNKEFFADHGKTGAPAAKEVNDVRDMLGDIYNFLDSVTKTALAE